MRTPCQRRLLGDSGFLARLEQARTLAAPAWGLLAAADVEQLLLLGDVRQNRSQPLVLDDRRLVDLSHLVECPVGQRTAPVLDHKPPGPGCLTPRLQRVSFSAPQTSPPWSDCPGSAS